MELPQGDPHGAATPGVAECLLCWAELSGVSSQARFCPRCGGELAGRAAAGAPVEAVPVVEAIVLAEDASPLEPTYWSLRTELEANLADATPRPVASSVVMLAYANALLNLGWRYAHGHGLMRNEAEAGRCYAKAGRLSEAWGR
jgi:hypothetical protein